MNNDICKAIKNKSIIEFYYKGHKCVVEPHCYGILTSTNNEALRAYRVGGYGSSERRPLWRLYNISEMHEIVVTDKKFENPRPGYKINDSDMSVIFCQILL